jgi:hypothetical protein
MEALAINTTVWSPNLYECVHRVLVRHLGCGDCSYFSSRERHRRVLVFRWNIQTGTRLQFGLLVSVEASFGRRKATTRVL